MSEVPVLTLDGPSGSGKGTIASRVARTLGWHLLDSGALYRLVALGAARRGIPMEDEAALADYALQMDVVFEVQPDSGEVLAKLDGEAVGDAIRTEQCGNDASKVAALGPVREALLQRQRDFRRPPGLVADGRDMGTTVFPDAGLKIYLTASAEVRAERRYKQLKEKGISASVADLFREIAERDARDTERRSSPLKPATDALVLDTSSLDINQVVDQVLEQCRERFDVNVR
ncbi:(d)CMP kinase [Thiohalophilus thiocyanatoxydans]|uniref:Cytidylate kinase n=1 Tax=Thiohalophilus thiocyanatoxydans TaxID=381308 RepID=A0A4R8IQR5_9GAMM|nr:(d)CMP kinase [Thiohalophilus thiocyanatoxydans]TDY02654.1 cytidylate kinase [Thiohalophilus thiocyanatoxydans]